MKKTLILTIVSLGIFILAFLYFWFLNELFDKLFLFAIFPIIFCFIGFVMCFVISILNLFIKEKDYFGDKIFKINKEKLFFKIVPVVINIITVIILIKFPFDTAKINLELKLYKEKRLEIISMIENKELSKDKQGNVKLPRGYKITANSGEAFVYKSDEEGTVVGFWIFRGMLSSYTTIIYTTGGEELIRDEIHSEILELKKLEDNWYYLHAE